MSFLDDHLSDDVLAPSFFQGFHPELDRWQALKELEAKRLNHRWVIIQGTSLPLQFVILKMETDATAWQEASANYFAKVPDHELKFSVNLHDGVRQANGWKEGLALAGLDPLQGL
jgi:hypothetical protein